MKERKAATFMKSGKALRRAETRFRMEGTLFMLFSGLSTLKVLSDLKFEAEMKNSTVPVITTKKSSIFQGSLR